MIKDNNRANPAKKIVIPDQSSAEIRTQFLRQQQAHASDNSKNRASHEDEEHGKTYDAYARGHLSIRRHWKSQHPNRLINKPSSVRTLPRMATIPEAVTDADGR